MEQSVMVTFTNKENEELTKKAFEKAKKSAESIAKAVNKKVGTIIEISSNAKIGSFKQSLTYYTYTFSISRDFTLNVEFELK